MFPLAAMSHRHCCPTPKECRCPFLRPPHPGRPREKQAQSKRQQHHHNKKHAPRCLATPASHGPAAKVFTVIAKGKRKRVDHKDKPPPLVGSTVDDEEEEGQNKARLLRKDEFYASLVKLSPQFEIAALGTKSLSGSFALLTKTPLPSADAIQVLLDEGGGHFDVALEPLLKSDGSRRVLRLSGKHINMKMVEQYTNSFLSRLTHAKNFALCIDPEFWRNMLVLPVEIVRNSFRWGVMQQVVQPKGNEQLNALMAMVAAGETGSQECARLMENISKGFFNQDDDFEAGDAASLLQMFVMEKKDTTGTRLYSAFGCQEIDPDLAEPEGAGGQEGGEEDGEKKKKKKKKKKKGSLVGFRLRPIVWQAMTVAGAMVQPPEGEEGEGEQDSDKVEVVPADQIRVIPIAVEWLQLGVLIGQVLPWVFNYIRVGWVQQKYPMLRDIPVEELCRAVKLEKTVRQDFKRLMHLGTVLLRYVLTSDRFIATEGSLTNASQRHDISLKCRVEVIGNAVPWEIAKLLLGLDIRMYMATDWDRASFDAPHTLQAANSLGYSHGELSLPLSPMVTNMVGKVVLAIVGVCYYNGGLTVVRSFCQQLGVIDGTTVGFFRTIEGERLHAWTFRYDWEKDKESYAKIQRIRSRNIHKMVGEFFGYRFNMWQRLGPAFRHFSKPLIQNDGVHFRALECLGEVAFLLTLSDHIFEAMPTVPQSAINRIYNNSVLQEIMGRIIAESRLVSYLVYNKDSIESTVIQGMKEYAKLTPNEVSGFKPPKLLYELFKALSGAILMDCCFNLDDFRKVMLPKVEPFLPSVVSMADQKLIESDSGYLTYGQYIPTHITPTVFKNAISAPTIRLHGNVIKFGGGIGNSGPGMEHGFVVLTGKKLPKFPALEMGTTAARTAMCKVSIKPMSDKPMTFTPDEMKIIESFQSSLYEDVMVPPISVAMPQGDFEKRYGFLPVIRRQGPSNEKGEWVVDWEFAKKVVNREVSPEWDEYLQKLGRGEMGGQDALELLDCITADSVFEAPPPEWPTDTKQEPAFKKTIHNPELLKPMQSIVWRCGEHLLWGSDIGVNGNPKAAAKSVVYLRGLCLNLTGIWSHVPTDSDVIPKACLCPKVWSNITNCKATPLSMRWFQRAAMLPSILWRMEGFLLASDFRSMYSIPSSMPSNVLLKVLTNVQALDWNPDWYFALGSTVVQYIIAMQIFLKNSTMAAGDMSKWQAHVLKESLVPPDNIHPLAGHLISSGFFPHKRRRPWHPPGVKPFVLMAAPKDGTSDANNEGDPEVGASNGALPAAEEVGAKLAKTIHKEGRVVSRAPHPVSLGVVNYHIKAVVGALYTHGGIRDATKFLHKVGVIRNARSRSKSRARRVANKTLYKLEKLIGYKFNDMGLLMEAFVYPTEHSTLDYNRLEYIGDQALEVLTVAYILEKHPSLSLADVNTLKVATVGNENLARMLMIKPFRLHRYLQHDVPYLEAELMQQERLADKVANKPPGELGGNLPKTAGDLFESVTGAVLVDSGFCLDTVWKVVHPMMKAFLTKWIDDPTHVLANRNLFM